MGTYIRQREIVRQLGLKDGEKTRMDCPFCGGTNTFAARKEYGKLFWRCFRMSCDACGSANVDMSVDEVVDIFTRPGEAEEDWRFIVPKYWTTPIPVDEAMDFIENMGCEEAYLGGTAHLMYDPRQHRLVFLCNKNGEVYDAVGRALAAHSKPKWMRYGVSNASFFCPHRAVGERTDGIILVEDCASACSASRVLDSMGILGTHFSKNSVADLMPYKVVYIALDPDALGKAYTLQQLISQYRPCKILQPKDDLKYFDADDIKELVEGADGKSSRAS